MNELYFHNHYHYGDCLTSLHFLIHLSRVNNIKCYFYCNEAYRSQLHEFIPNDSNLSLIDVCNSNSIDVWGYSLIKKLEEYPFFCQNYPEHIDVLKTCFEMWKNFTVSLNLKYPFTKVEDVLFDQEEIGYPINQSYDVLLINSYCLSGQIRYSTQEQDDIFRNIIHNLQQKNKTFITTHKLDDYPSTWDQNLSLLKIAQLAKNCKIVLGVPTSPFWVSLNKWSFKNCDKFINFTHDICTFDLGSKFITVHSLDQALNYLGD